MDADRSASYLRPSACICGWFRFSRFAYTRGMPLCRLMLLAGVGLSVFAQAPCNNTPAFTPCEFAFDLNPQEAAAHPNPYVDVELSAEFRSPHFHTFKLTAFWDGGQRLVIRFTPTEAGEWLWRVSSNVQRWEGQSGAFTAAESDAPGFVRAANVHHWAWTAGLGHQPHLWMGDTLYPFAFLDQALFQRIVDARAAQRFNHLRGLVLGTAEQAARIFPSPDRPNPEHFQHLDQSIRYMNQKGIVADLIVAGPQNQLARLFPNWQQRRRYIGYIVARYAGMNVTWQGVQAFETYDTGRALMKEIGGLLEQMDTYQHPGPSGNLAPSGALMDDGWMDFVAHHTGDDQVCAVEHQLFPTPFVNLKFAGEDSGAGKSQPDDVDSNAFRHRLWNAVMDGDYPTYFNSGTAGDGTMPVDARHPHSPRAQGLARREGHDRVLQLFCGQPPLGIGALFRSGQRPRTGGRRIQPGRRRHLSSRIYRLRGKTRSRGIAGGKPQLRRYLDQPDRRRRTQGEERLPRRAFHRPATRQLARLGVARFARSSQGGHAEVLQVRVAAHRHASGGAEHPESALRDRAACGYGDFGDQAALVRGQIQEGNARHPQHDVALDRRGHRGWRGIPRPRNQPKRHHRFPAAHRRELSGGDGPAPLRHERQRQSL